MAIPTSRTKEPGRIFINTLKCDGCGHCVKVCSDFGFELVDHKAVISKNSIFGCVACGRGRVIRTAVGDQNVLAAMLEEDLAVGGEQSGHIILRDFSTTGDGLIAALQVLRIMKSQDKPLSQLTRGWARFPQKLTNLKVKEKRPWEQIGEIADLVKQAETELGRDGGRVLLRYSGTEPKIRLLLEGRDASALDDWSAKIMQAIQRHLVP